MTPPTRGWKPLIPVALLTFGLAACSQDGSSPLQPDDSGSLGTSARGKDGSGSDSKPVLDPAGVIVATNSALAFADVTAEFERLLERHPDRRRESARDGFRPQQNDVDALIGHAVVA